MFWTNYLYLCKSVGKAPNAVASELGIKSSGTVSAWKNGSLPRQKAANDIAAYFGVNADDLINVDLTKEKKPIPKSVDELSELFSISLDGLRSDEIAKVHAFVAGLKASRMP